MFGFVEHVVGCMCMDVLEHQFSMLVKWQGKGGDFECQKSNCWRVLECDDWFVKLHVVM